MSERRSAGPEYFSSQTKSSVNCKVRCLTPRRHRMVFAYCIAAFFPFGGRPPGYVLKNASCDMILALPLMDVRGFMLKSAVIYDSLGRTSNGPLNFLPTESSSGEQNHWICAHISSSPSSSVSENVQITPAQSLPCSGDLSSTASPILTEKLPIFAPTMRRFLPDALSALALRLREGVSSTFWTLATESSYIQCHGKSSDPSSSSESALRSPPLVSHFREG